METLHTILLGPYKYLLKATIPTLSTEEKEKVLAQMRCFNYSGFTGRVYGNIISYHKSFVGRDYKAWAQMALFVIGDYLSEGQRRVLLSLSKVHVYVQTHIYTCILVTPQILRDTVDISYILNLQVFRIAYCIPFREEDELLCQEVCQQFVDTAKQYLPELLQKRKVHMLLHLVECMREFGPTASFNTERYACHEHVYSYISRWRHESHHCMV